MKRQRAPLGELCSLIKGTSPISKTSPGKYPLVTTGEAHKTADCFQFDGDAVCIPLISSTGHGHASIKRVHYQAGKFALANILAAAIVKDKAVLSTQFLARYLMFTKDRLIVPLMTGAANMSVSLDRLATVPVEFPSIAEQMRIVELFNEADELRKLRAQADLRMSDLAPALFNKMFGDPAQNSMGWPARRLRELAEKYSDGPFGSNLKSSHYTPEGVRVVRLQNIGVGHFVDADKAYISLQHFERLRKHECLPGDVLVGTLGAPNLRACILPSNIHHALNKADCIQFRPNPKLVTSAFICWVLNMPRTLEMATGMILGQTRARISMGRLGELIIPLPPLSLQEEFEHRMNGIHEVEAAQARNNERLNALFQSMLHRAFTETL